VAGGIAVLAIELLTYPELEGGLAASLAALLLVLALLVIAVWDLILAKYSPGTLTAQQAFFPIPLSLRPLLFAIGLGIGLWFGITQW
jgi:hypothetical protein